MEATGLNIGLPRMLALGRTDDTLASILDSETKREDLKEYDQLRVERGGGTNFVRLREGDF